MQAKILPRLKAVFKQQVPGWTAAAATLAHALAHSSSKLAQSRVATKVVQGQEEPLGRAALSLIEGGAQALPMGNLRKQGMATVSSVSTWAWDCALCTVHCVHSRWRHLVTTVVAARTCDGGVAATSLGVAICGHMCCVAWSCLVQGGCRTTQTQWCQATSGLTPDLTPT